MSEIGTGLWDDAARRRLVRLCERLTGDRHAAEDLAQETLLEAWRNAHKLHDPTGADHWLAAIARNVCLRWARSRGREPARLDVFEAGGPPGPGGGVGRARGRAGRRGARAGTVGARRAARRRARLAHSGGARGARPPVRARVDARG